MRVGCYRTRGGPTLRLVEDTARAELATASAARDASDFARGIAAEVTTTRPPAARIREARELRLLALAVLDRAVVLELIAGTSWEDVSEALMLPLEETIRRYGPTVHAFRDGSPIAVPSTIITSDSASGLPMDTDPEGTAAAIDQWLDRHLDPWEHGARGPRLAARFTT